MKLLNKKGQALSALQGFIFALVTIAVVLAMGLFILQEVQWATTSDGTSSGTATAASNATGSIITKLAGVPTWIGILIVVVFATAVLAYFYFRQ